MQRSCSIKPSAAVYVVPLHAPTNKRNSVRITTRWCALIGTLERVAQDFYACNPCPLKRALQGKGSTGNDMKTKQNAIIYRGRDALFMVCLVSVLTVGSKAQHISEASLNEDHVYRDISKERCARAVFGKGQQSYAVHQQPYAVHQRKRVLDHLWLGSGYWT